MPARVRGPRAGMSQRSSSRTEGGTQGVVVPVWPRAPWPTFPGHRPISWIRRWRRRWSR